MVLFMTEVFTSFFLSPQAQVKFYVSSECRIGQLSDSAIARSGNCQIGQLSDCPPAASYAATNAAQLATGAQVAIVLPSSVVHTA